MTGTGTQNDPYIIADWSDFITAVGTSAAYVEFPKNLVRTSDTEVDPNKLYTDSTGTVQTNVQPSDLTNLYENTFVLDANDYAPAGLTAAILIKCASINGYGGTIKNLASSTNAIFIFISVTMVTGLAILNINTEGQNFIDQAWGNDYNQITKCIFSGRIASSNENYFDRQYFAKYTSCAFTVTLSGAYVGMFYQAYSTSASLDACRVQITKTDQTSTNMYITAKNSYVSGSINQPLRIFSPSDYTVLDIEAPSYVASNSMQSNTLANSDKCSNIDAYLTSVTTAQMKDAAYLSSIGFPIQT